MFLRLCLSLALLATLPARAQIGVVPFETTARPSDEDRMLTPPPISGEAYPTTVGAQTHSNYLATGLRLNSAFDDNVVVGNTITPVRDVIYSILPTIMLNQTTPRHELTLQYSPGFTFYQNTSSLNAVDQTAALSYQYRLNQHATLSLNDFFQKSSNVFDELNPLSAGAVSTPTQSTPVEVVAPYANRLNNTANVGLSYQFRRNSMIGAGGNFMENNYLNSTQASNFYNSNSAGGSLFYSQRLSETRYLGVTYQYLNSHSNPVDAQVSSVNAQTGVRTHTIVAFYTIYLNSTLSLSLSGGPQYYEAVQPSSPQIGSWAPSATASMGWQRSRTNFVANYSRTVTGGTGLLGAFSSNSANTSARWLIARTWTVGLEGGYSINKNILPLFASSSPGGHTVSGNALVQHSMGEHLEAAFGYARLHQSYSGIALTSGTPDSNREYVSVSYQFTRPLGR